MSEPKTDAQIEQTHRLMDFQEMQRDLLGGGWTRITGDCWQTPWGDYYRGPYAAWCIWAGVEKRKP